MITALSILGIVIATIVMVVAQLRLLDRRLMLDAMGEKLLSTITALPVGVAQWTEGWSEGKHGWQVQFGVNLTPTEEQVKMAVATYVDAQRLTSYPEEITTQGEFLRHVHCNVHRILDREELLAS